VTCYPSNRKVKIEKNYYKELVPPQKKILKGKPKRKINPKKVVVKIYKKT
jgi:hypothetical protein